MNYRDGNVSLVVALLGPLSQGYQLGANPLVLLPVALLTITRAIGKHLTLCTPLDILLLPTLLTLEVASKFFFGHVPHNLLHHRCCRICAH
jgi:hypothetical protein